MTTVLGALAVFRVGLGHGMAFGTSIDYDKLHHIGGEKQNRKRVKGGSYQEEK